MELIEPILTVELFPKLSGELLTLLKRLSLTDWEKPTACPGWSVKDVVAHLLGGNIGRLSFGRDNLPHPDASPPTTFTELRNLIDQENAEWVKAARRISPNLLVEFLELTDRQLYLYFKTRPPDEPASISVAWAGDQESPNWFDIAREYTEKWLHQQHIREAVGEPLLAARNWLFPVMDTFMRALPYAYRTMAMPDGTQIAFHITGEAGGDWSLLRQDGTWALFWGTASKAVASIWLDQDLAWRLFTKGMSPETAQLSVRIEGDKMLGSGILYMVSIMA